MASDRNSLSAIAMDDLSNRGNEQPHQVIHDSRATPAAVQHLATDVSNNNTPFNSQRVTAADTSDDDSHLRPNSDRAYEADQTEEHDQHTVTPSAKTPLVDTLPAKHEKTKTPTKSHILFWWLPEIVATALSLIAFVSTIVLLRVYDGRVAATLHLPRYLTLNGLLALISTINKACLTTPVASAVMQEMWLYFAQEARMKSCKSKLRDLDLFANAASGPVGSLVFLLRARLTRLFACLACFVIVLSLSYDTSTQQLVGLELRSDTNIGPLANIPRSETWNQYTEVGDEDLFPPLDMIGALYSGTLGVGMTPLQAQCPSGNCTWPTTPSMAVCGECVPSLFRIYGCAPDGYGACTYEFVSGDRVVLADYRDLAALSNDSKITQAFAALPNSANIRTDTADGSRAYLANWYMFGAPYGARRNELLNFHNTECALWMCVNAYNTTIKDGVQQETPVSTFDRFVPDYNTTGGLDASQTGAWRLREPGSGTEFVVNTRSLVTLGLFVKTAMDGTVFLSNGTGPTYLGNVDFMRGIWKGSAQPSAWIEQVALSMTKIVRSANVSNRDQYSGTQRVLTVHVRWEWLVVPATLVLMSALILGIVIVRTIRSPVPAWKGNPLMLLLFGLDNNLREVAAGQVEKRHGADEAIGERRVRFEKADDGLWQFQAAD